MNILNNQLKTLLLTADDNSQFDQTQLVNEKKAALKAYFKNTWATYESLFSLINADEAYFLRPEPLRHPLIFYFGHTATFYINKLILGKYINKRVNKKLEAICAVGVDEMSWDDLNSEHYDWPSVAEVKEYRDQVAQLIENLIDTMELSLPITKDSLAWVLLMGIEHERIHIETSSVIMRMLDLKYLTGQGKQYQAWQACTVSGEAPTNQLLNVAKQTIVLGKPDNDHTYGWDNEYGQQHIEVDEFSASQYLVSNQEFLAFVEDGGYSKFEYWTTEGQQWLKFTQATMPRFWFKQDNHYVQRNLLEEIPLPLNWPVEVNYLEAKAFCHWKSQQSDKHIRLPTEAEWQCLRNTIDDDLVSWDKAPGNINLEYYASPCPVDQFEQQGFYDVMGNVWQWTESTIDGFTGFEVHPLYDDFSTPTFDGKHNLIKGGSWISTGNEAIKSARYAFRRHFMQHAGFRYISSNNANLPKQAFNPYEIDNDICQQLAGHYGPFNHLLMPTDNHSTNAFMADNYQKSLANYVKDISEKYQCAKNKLLDLGCSVGRTSFELANTFLFIDAIDFSARYIRYGVQLQRGDNIRFTTQKEGELFDFNEINLNKLDLPEAKNISFSQGDASNLKSIFNQYDVVLAQNIIENNHHPKLFLTTINKRINDKGLLIMVSNYSFNEDKTAKTQWLGGIKVNGENVTGFAGITEILSDKFNLLDQQELIKVSPINQRNFDISVMHITVWQKK